MKGKCDGCSTMIAIELAEDHVRQCTDILEECLCQQKITRKDRLAHMQVCPKEEVTCECGFKTKREEETGHKKNDCRFGQVDCPLMCGAMVTRYFTLYPVYSPRGYSGCFKSDGVEGFLGFEIYYLGIIGVSKFWQVFFG